MTILHHDRLEQQFGDSYQFVRCGQFASSKIDFPRWLSEVIDADVENSENLTPLQRALSFKEMVFIIYNGAKFILDPRGVNGKVTYDVVKEHLVSPCPQPVKLSKLQNHLLTLPAGPSIASTRTASGRIPPTIPPHNSTLSTLSHLISHRRTTGRVGERSTGQGVGATHGECTSGRTREELSQYYWALVSLPRVSGT